MADEIPEEDQAAALFGAAAHEIKNALVPLAMTLQLVERDLLAGRPVAAPDLAFARGQVRRLSRLVEDLMDTSRADLGQLEICTVTVDVCATVRGAVEIFRRGHARPVGLAAPSEGLALQADPGRIEQVVLNLLENADRYSPDGALIEVSIARRPRGAGETGRARIAVRDRGPGIPVDERARIFDRFVRGSSAAGTGGLGIGLYLCRTIIERHGGTIGIDTDGTGATFWIELDVV